MGLAWQAWVPHVHRLHPQTSQAGRSQSETSFFLPLIYYVSSTLTQFLNHFPPSTRRLHQHQQPRSPLSYTHARYINTLHDSCSPARLFYPHIHTVIMARGNQRDLARAKNLKKQGEMVSSPTPPCSSSISQKSTAQPPCLLLASPQREHS